jgi:hypothetical protein
VSGAITPAPPLPPLPVLAAPVAPPTAALPPPALLSPALPSVLPVQLLTLPLALNADKPPNLLAGTLQLLPNQTASLNTALGAVTFALPSLTAYPGLIAALQDFIAANPTHYLQLTTTAHGTLEARLVCPAALDITSETAAPATLLSQTALALNALLGRTLQAVILPTSSHAAVQTVGAGGAQAAGAAASLAPTALPALLQAGLSPETINGQGAGQGAGQRVAPVVALSIQQVIPPGQALPSLQAGEALARVLPAPAAASLSQPLLQLEETTLLLKTNLPLLPGSSVIVKILPAEAAGASGLTASTAHRAPAAAWSALTDVLNIPQEPALQAFLQQRVPHLAAAFPGALLFALKALQQGDARGWLGKAAVGAVERGQRMPLLAALQAELGQSRGSTSDALVGDWQSYQLPWLAPPPQAAPSTPPQLLPLQLYVHHNQTASEREATNPEAAKAAQQTRFVLDLTLTRLGALQLDGFMQRQQFDLVIRTHQPLGATLEQELRTAFTDALGATGYHGQLLFQIGGHNWLYLAAKPLVPHAV